MGWYSYLHELVAEFVQLFSASGYANDPSYDFNVLGVALLAAGIVLRLFWALTAPDNKKL